MTSSRNIQDYRYLTHPELWHQSPQNTEYIQKFIVRKRASGATMNTINSYLYRITLYLGLIGKEIDDITTDDILEVYMDRQDMVARGEYSESTLDGDIVTLKQFFIALFGKERAKELVPIVRRHKLNNRPSTDYLTTAHVRIMRDTAEAEGDIRGTALIMLCFGTGARISEILDANVGDVDVKQYHATLKVNGKTGAREIPFVNGLPELLNWLAAHPVKMKDGKPNPEAPLFVTKNTRGHGVQRLHRKTVEAYFQRIAEAAGIPPEVKTNPHAFRHLLATILAKKLGIKEMNLFFGWSPQSTIALNYIHTSQQTLENSVLEINGVERVDEETEEIGFFVQCPSCRTILPAGSKWCPRCRMILDPVLAVQMSKVTNDMSGRDAVEQYLKN